MSRLILPVAGTTSGSQRGVAPPRHSCCYACPARLALQPASGTINRQFRRDTTLERQIGTLYYERLLPGRASAGAIAAAGQAAQAQDALPRDFVRDPVMLEFLGLPDTGRLLEPDLERALMDKLQQFLLELGTGFAFVARQQRIGTETQDFHVDLVFYNYLLKCFVLLDLRTCLRPRRELRKCPFGMGCKARCAAHSRSYGQVPQRSRPPEGALAQLPSGS